MNEFLIYINSIEEASYCLFTGSILIMLMLAVLFIGLSYMKIRNKFFNEFKHRKKLPPFIDTDLEHGGWITSEEAEEKYR